MQSEKSVIVSDMGGVIYSFSPTFDPDEHMRKFDENVAWYSNHYPEFKNAVVEYEKGNYEQALEIEKLGINAWFSGKTSDGALAVYFHKTGLKNLCINTKKYKIVIVSTSPAENTELILQEGLKSIDEDSDIVEEFDIYNMSLYGSKKDSQAWMKILRQYHDIIAVVEDNENNLEAAFVAAKSITPNVVKSIEMAVI